MAFSLRGYYGILDATSDDLEGAVDATGGEDLSPLLARARRLLGAGPSCLQLRAKSASSAELFAVATAVRALCRADGVPFCMNDRLDVALAVDAELVHLGQDDLPLEAARRIANGRLRIGVSTHNRDQALAAAAGGADYIGFGPVFPTTSKNNPDPVVGVEQLQAVCAALSIPVVAIGGITFDRIPDLAAAGASAAALIAAMEHAADPTEAGRRIRAAFGATGR